jgi:hypothetical protein
VLRTYDQNTIDSAGAFLVGELERMDKELHAPLFETTWGRDIDLREDVTIGDAASSFTNSDFGAPGSISTKGKNWVGPDSNAIAAVNVNTTKTTNPMHLWALQVGWTIPELSASQQLGRPVDTQKHEALRVKHQMDVDEQVYVGDTDLGITGLVNNAAISPLGFSTAWDDEAMTPKLILEDVNDFLNTAWAQTGYSVIPDRLLLPPLQFGLLTQPVTDAGSESLLAYIARSCVSAQKNGRPLDIKPLKWLSGRGAGSTDRAVAYSRNKRFVRFPMVPLQRTPLEYRGLAQLCTYFGTLGEVEFVYPETVAYADGL